MSRSPGAAEAVARLRAPGDDVVFVTNNSSQPVRRGRGQARGPRHPRRGRRHHLGHGRGRARGAGRARAGVRRAGRGGGARAPGRRGGARRRRRRGDGGVPPATSTTSGCGSRRARSAAAPACWPPTTTRPTPRQTDRSPGGGAILAAVVDRDGRRAGGGGQAARPMADLVRARLGDVGVMVGRPSRHRRALRPGARLPLRAGAHRRHAGRGPRRPRARSRGARPRDRWSPTSCANSCKHLRVARRLARWLRTTC